MVRTATRCTEEHDEYLINNRIDTNDGRLCGNRQLKQGSSLNTLRTNPVDGAARHYVGLVSKYFPLLRSLDAQLQLRLQLTRAATRFVQGKGFCRQLASLV